MTARLKIAYVSRLIFPDPAANALQTVQMAAAFARQNGGAHLFVHDLAEAEVQIRERYAIAESQLRFCWLHANRWPPRIYRNGKARFLIFNSAVAAILGFHPAWHGARTQPKALFVRSRLECLYWGLVRPYLWWLRRWLMVFEAHDLQVPFHQGDVRPCEYDSPRARQALRALKNYDLVLAVTQGLAEDIRVFTRGCVEPKVVPLCTGLPRLISSPVVAAAFSTQRVLLGYIGTVDSAHGMEDLFEALELLPKNCVLRIVGRVGTDAKSRIDAWKAHPSLGARIEVKPPVDYSEVAREIDDCHILLLPAGNTVHSRRYRSPLKLFDYMARGKPIVAAGVPCHLELLRHGVHAQFYRPNDPRDLAASIVSLIEQPQKAESLAKAAWEESLNYTYEARAARILKLLAEVWEQRVKRS